MEKRGQPPFVEIVPTSISVPISICVQYKLKCLHMLTLQPTELYAWLSASVTIFKKKNLDLATVQDCWENLR